MMIQTKNNQFFKIINIELNMRVVFLTVEYDSAEYFY